MHAVPFAFALRTAVKAGAVSLNDRLKQLVRLLLQVDVEPRPTTSQSTGG